MQGHTLERLFPGIGRLDDNFPGVGIDGPSIGESVDEGEGNLESAIRQGGPGTAIGLSEGALVLNAVLAILWVPRHGALGAAAASSVGYACGGLGMAAVYCRYVGIGFPTLWRYRRSDFDFIRQRWPGFLKLRGSTP